MNCNEFREKIKSGADFSEELQNHKNTCQECQNWILKEISSPPEGISKEKWESTLSKFTDKGNKEENKKIEKTEVEDKTISQENKEEKSLLDYYFIGLKYGLVLGLAIVVGFSILEIKKENKDTKLTKEYNNTSDNANTATNTSLLSIATDTELIPLPNIQSK